MGILLHIIYHIVCFVVGLVLLVLIDAFLQKVFLKTGGEEYGKNSKNYRGRIGRSFGGSS